LRKRGGGGVEETEVLEGLAAEEAEVGLFRFQMEFLEGVMDGRIHVLRAGVHYPRLMSFTMLRQRLYQAARTRDGHARVRRLADNAIQVQFLRKPPIRIPPTMVVPDVQED
jgi:hypothetical protein